MTKEIKSAEIADQDTGDTALISKLKKHKKDNVGSDRTTLPETGIEVTWPKFKPHSIWSKATRLSKKSPLSVTDNYLPLLCKFDGENMTIDEFKQYIPTDDILHLTGEVMGDDEEDEDLGNAPT